MALILPYSVFYHIPKTGGVWVGTALKYMGLVEKEYIEDNYPMDELNLRREHISPLHADPEVVKNKSSFAFIRSPITWYQSFWRYKQRNWDEPYLDYKSPDFNDFIRKITSKSPGFLTRIYKEFSGVTRLGKQENLRDDLVSILEAFGEYVDYDIVKKLRPMNVSRYEEEPAHYEYEPKSLKKIKEVEKWIFKKYYPEEL